MRNVDNKDDFWYHKLTWNAIAYQSYLIQESFSKSQVGLIIVFQASNFTLTFEKQMQKIFIW